MSELKDKQALFLKNIGLLIGYVNTLQGWQMTEGEGERPAWVAKVYQEQGKGIANSLHTDRLAHDFNFYFNGAYITDKEMLRPIATYWLALHIDNRWGGNFSHYADVFHFSMTYGGRQ